MTKQIPDPEDVLAALSSGVYVKTEEAIQSIRALLNGQQVQFLDGSIGIISMFSDHGFDVSFPDGSHLEFFIRHTGGGQPVNCAEDREQDK